MKKEQTLQEKIIDLEFEVKMLEDTNDVLKVKNKELKEQLSIQGVIKWVAIKDTLPKDGCWILAFVNKSRKFCWYDKEKGFKNTFGLKEKKVTHWMKIPEPPFL